MKLILNGTSSSGKTSIMKLFPIKYKKLSMDNFYNDIFCFHKIKPVQSLYKNKYYSKKEHEKIHRIYLWDYFKKQTRNVTNFIIDQVDTKNQLGLSNYLKKNNVKGIINVLLYTNLYDLIRNIDKRRGFEPRSKWLFTRQFCKLYTYTKDKEEAIGTVCFNKFVKDLKKIKYEFVDEKELISFAKQVFNLLNIKRIIKYKEYHIKPVCKYDLVLNSSNKSSKQIFTKLCKIG